jgi:hypothetical protein
MQFETTNTRTETMACQEVEAHPEVEKPVSVDTKPEAAQQEEVPMEDATVILVVETEEESSNTRKETMSCQEMDARQDEQKPTPVDRKPETAKEVPVEDAVVKPVNGRKKRHRGQEASCRAMRGARGTDPRTLWILEEVGCHL